MILLSLADPVACLPNGAVICFGELFQQAVEAVVVVADLLQGTAAIDTGHWVVAVFGVDVQAGLAVFVFLNQAHVVHSQMKRVSPSGNPWSSGSCSPIGFHSDHAGRS